MGAVRSIASKRAQGMMLARVVAITVEGCVVRCGGEERTIPVDPAVDPALLEENTPVVIDDGVLVGVLATQRSMTVDREGRVRADLKSFEVATEEKFVLSTPGAFIQAKTYDVEIYGTRVLTRARELAKVLAGMIRLN